ncbi:2-oxoacid:ferredoxin oxidoreductase subunit beta [Sulfobacillus thermosulfidooxidans]|uniref:2-oxoacid:ferredoxin oxidoreductase subunit beta n=1 Tax=Sulfobacillus thermosulfidooxidans TaxID=28034 RepID=UPI00096BA8C0|nr:2-oxoacid:ferredoxin oxidoreductase subunit beta [Sulfobacillus thermosulfidooxidans]OLZ11780.1 2-oxoacid ferredoxin oxidoreductase [Sulfobacillus thermosulfidooxidans]OLZ17082.1 2-oxoacid ferredoxin oxidoreductase [Sulfobacillus thermosulfidooxidans]OLZ20178.1 2-oxoacid ferredoxin oxidoreductase [Sulfobacillus thermosulfidooxidans]
MATLQDFKTQEKSWWCPGCGDFGVLAALEKALVEVGADPSTTAIIAGIGCSGKIGNYINSYNLHVTHGRTLPSAMGVKLANRDLTVLAVGGDGDAYAIGMGHFMHALRRNVNITYIVMDNHVYGLTKGQTSPTSEIGFHTKTSPDGSIDTPVHPLMLAVAGGATYVAQGFSSWQPQLAHLIVEGIKHPGFAMINVISPCVTYNRVNTYEWYKKTLVNLDEDPSYRPTSRAIALTRLEETDELVTGLIYQEPSVPYEDQIPGFSKQPIVNQNWHIDAALWNQILEHFE